MNNYQFSKELDIALCDFIARPSNFIDNIRFVHSLLTYPLVAVSDNFVLPISDKFVLPVFTTDEALMTFKQQITEELTFINKPFISVVDELLNQKFDAIAFNIQPAGQDADNATMLPREHLVTFINRFIDVLNKLSANDKHESIHEKYFLIPSFATIEADGKVTRQFATLANPQGDDFVPAFSSLLSFAKWYNHQEFGVPFQKSRGVVLTWKLSELAQPSSGKNDLSGIQGVAIDPFESSDYNASILLWQDIIKP